MTERADFMDSIRQLAATVLVESTDSSPPINTSISTPSESESPNDETRPLRLRSKLGGRQANLTRQRELAEPNVVTVTSRYPKEIDLLITKASFAQRMKGLTPGTKQEILVDAAREWLNRNGYLRPEEVGGPAVANRTA